MNSLWEHTRFDMVDPTTLITDSNTRTIGDIQAEDPAFCSLIEKHGVVIPIILAESADGLRVRDGHRRVAASCLERAIAQHPQVPALITTADDPNTIAWIRDQWIANMWQVGYTNADTASIMEQMELKFGLNPEQIAAELGADVALVRAGIAVRRSPRTHSAVVDNPQLDMFAMAKLAQLEDDADAHQAALETLKDDPVRFDAKVAKLVRDREIRIKIDQVTADLTTAGVTIIDYDAYYEAVPVDELVANERDRTPLTPQEHSDCPGHAAFVDDDADGEIEVYYVCTAPEENGHRTTDDLLAQDTAEKLRAEGLTIVDADLDADTKPLYRLHRSTIDRTILTAKDHEGCPGHAAFITVRDGDARPIHICRGFVQNGHADVAAGRQETKDEKKSENSALHNLRTKENNKAWIQAKKDRRAALDLLFSTPALPKKILTRLEQRLAIARVESRDHLPTAQKHSYPYARKLLKIKPHLQGAPDPLITRLNNATKAEALRIELALVLGGFEQRYDLVTTDKIAIWRKPGDDDKVYFQLLKDLGPAFNFVLADVEELVLDTTYDHAKWPAHFGVEQTTTGTDGEGAAEAGTDASAAEPVTVDTDDDAGAPAADSEDDTEAAA